MRPTAVVLSILFVVTGSAALFAETNSKRVGFENEQWIKVGLRSEGIEITEIRFKIEGGIHYNPLRLGKGPQCFVELKNAGSHEISAAIGLALFDDAGNLVAATESRHGGLEAGDSAEVKMTFREVYRRMHEAKTVHVVLETWK